MDFHAARNPGALPQAAYDAAPSALTGTVFSHLRSGAFLEDIIVDRVHAPQRFGRDLGIGNADAESFFHAHDQFEGVDGIETEAARAEERQVVTDFLSRRLEHQVFDQHFFDALA